MPRLDSVPGAGIFVDKEYRITDGNVRSEIVFRKDIEQIRGTTLETLREWELFSQEQIEEWKENIDAILTGEHEEITDQITLTPEGDDEYVYERRMTPVEQRGDDQPPVVCCSLRSVGTSRRYEQTVTALHAATRELMTADSVDEVLRRVAVAAHEVLGFPGTSVRRYDPDAELLRHVAFGARVNKIETRPPYPIDDSPHGRAFRRGETVIDDIDSDDDPFDREEFTQTMYIPIGETGTLSIGIVGKRFDEIDVQFAEILAENGAAAITVVDTTESLRAERERLDKFASVISHDLRNPLEIAQLYLDFAADTGDEEDFETVRNALDRMDTMIEDLLTMARANEKINKSDSVRLNRLVERTWQYVTTDGATIESTVPEETTIVCDPNLMQNVFENLFRNAVEHATNGQTDGHVTITVGMLQDNRGFYVEDDGPGIPPDQREDIFDHGYTTDKRGNGFGLSIVESLVEAHDWSVTATEGQSGGARFEIWFDQAHSPS